MAIILSEEFLKRVYDQSRQCGDRDSALVAIIKAGKVNWADVAHVAVLSRAACDGHMGAILGYDQAQVTECRAKKPYDKAKGRNTTDYRTKEEDNAYSASRKWVSTIMLRAGKPAKVTKRKPRVPGTSDKGAKAQAAQAGDNAISNELSRPAPKTIADVMAFALTEADRIAQFETRATQAHLELAALGTLFRDFVANARKLAKLETKPAAPVAPAKK